MTRKRCDNMETDSLFFQLLFLLYRKQTSDIKLMRDLFLLVKLNLRCSRICGRFLIITAVTAAC